MCARHARTQTNDVGDRQAKGSPGYCESCIRYLAWYEFWWLWKQLNESYGYAGKGRGCWPCAHLEEPRKGYPVVLLSIVRMAGANGRTRRRIYAGNFVQRRSSGMGRKIILWGLHQYFGTSYAHANQGAVLSPGCSISSGNTGISVRPLLGFC
jgi:hypothetical protein